MIYDFLLGFEQKVLDILAQIVDSQKRQEEMLAGLISEKSDAVLEDLIPAPFNDNDAFESFNRELEDKVFRRKIVSFEMVYKM